MPVRTACSPAPSPLTAALCPGQGTRDHPPAQTALRDRLLSAVVSCFKRHGAAAIDTPVLELRVRRGGNSLPPWCGEGTRPRGCGFPSAPFYGTGEHPLPPGLQGRFGGSPCVGHGRWGGQVDIHSWFSF